MSNQNELKSLEKALSNENFKESYIIFLKIFKEIEFLKKNKEYTKNFLVLINREKVKLIYSEKENLLAESISEIFQNVELYSDDLNQTHRGGLFFKKQINNYRGYAGGEKDFC